MSATGPFANILSERAALLEVVAGAVAEEEPDDELGSEDELEVKVAGRELVEVSVVEVSVVGETVGSAVEELLETVGDVLGIEGDVVSTEVVGEVAGEDGNGDSVIGPGPRLNRSINK